RWSYPL
ncbi:polymorphic outer membrane protein, partial [Chlamydia psittaci 06-1683]